MIRVATGDPRADNCDAFWDGTHFLASPNGRSPAAVSWVWRYPSGQLYNLPTAMSTANGNFDLYRAHLDLAWIIDQVLTQQPTQPPTA